MPSYSALRWTLPAAAALLLAACSDTTAPDAAPEISPQPQTLVALACTANRLEERVTCGGPLPGNASNIIVGGQNVYVTLTGSEIQVAADTFSFAVTVTNLLPQPLGTTDRAIPVENESRVPDAAGVRVFFLTAPTSRGTGTITVANPDGTGTFTASDQPYFQYGQVLETNATSDSLRWKLHLTPDVVEFDFLVAVAAQVPYPDGYLLDNPYVLTLDPSESRTLSATVYSPVGNVVAEPVDWASSDPTLVSISGSQATAGASNGHGEITPTSGPRPALYTTAAAVCPSVVVATGHNSAQTIATTDCFSAFGSNDFRPSTSYYGDLFRVTLTAGQTILITLDSGDALDTYLILADPSGTAVAVNDDDDVGTLGVGSRVQYTATVSGVYVFEASTFNGLDTGNYALDVTIS